MKRDTVLTIKLPDGEYAVREPRRFEPPKRPFNRVALAAAHVVADPVSTREPWLDAAIDWVARMGGYAVAVLAVLLAVYMTVKWFERYRFLTQLRAARIAVTELYDMIERGEEPLILDVRSAAALGADRRRIPRAMLIDPEAPDAALGGLPRDRDIVVYCS